jgi:hypothetical protein
MQRQVYISRSKHHVSDGQNRVRANSLRHLYSDCPVLAQSDRAATLQVRARGGVRDNTKPCPVCYRGLGVGSGRLRVRPRSEADVKADVQRVRSARKEATAQFEETMTKGWVRRLHRNRVHRQAQNDRAAADVELYDLQAELKGLRDRAREERERAREVNRAEARRVASAETAERRRLAALKRLKKGPFALVLTGVASRSGQQRSESEMAAAISDATGIAVPQARRTLQRAIHVEPQPLLDEIAETTAIRIKMNLETSFGARLRIVRTGASDGLARKPIPPRVRSEVWNRDGGQCVDCGSRERLEYDHIVPISKGGANTARNLEIRCESCNRRKGASI